MENLKNELKAKMKITIFRVTEMAFSVKQEVEITGKINDKFTCKYKGKRKEYYFEPKAQDILFEGWNIPFATDQEVYNTFHANACFNFAGASKEVVTDYLLTKTLNNLPNSVLGKCLLIQHGGDETLLFPDIEISHAVIDRIKRKVLQS